MRDLRTTTVRYTSSTGTSVYLSTTTYGGGQNSVPLAVEGAPETIHVGARVVSRTTGHPTPASAADAWQGPGGLYGITVSLAGSARLQDTLRLLDEIEASVKR